MSLAGKILYHAWHRHYGPLRDLWLDGGPWQRRRTAQGREAMEAAAYRLPIPAPATGPELELHLLTGRRFWYQTAFCLWTFARQSRQPLRPVIHDDGTLAPEHREALRRLFPAARFHDWADRLARLDAHLPRARFPVLRARGDEFPLLHKLTAPHVGEHGWKLLIDSDLLFFRPPQLLLDWLARPQQPLHATDIQNAYGYPLALLAELAGRPVAERVNTGLLGLCSDRLDWERLEYWCRELQTRVGPHYYQEQALVALLTAGQPCVVAPLRDYVTLPTPPEALARRAVMHHYVAHSKRWYFQHNWRAVLEAP